MRNHRRLVVVLVLGGSLGLWTARQAKLSELRADLAAASERRSELRERISAARADLGSISAALEGTQREREQIRKELELAERELIKADPETQWAMPPGEWPQWDPSSPYLWIRKEFLPGLSMQVFTDQGVLPDEVAKVLALAPDQKKALNEALPRLMEEYQALEVAKAERVDEPLPGISDDGPRLTVRVPPLPEEGSRLKQLFERTLREQVGDQRADLLLRCARGWLETRFSRVGAEPKTISLVRHPNGSYNISIKSGSNWLSIGGPTDVTDYVPAHLLPLFSEVLGQPDRP